MSHVDKYFCFHKNGAHTVRTSVCVQLRVNLYDTHTLSPKNIHTKD